MVVSIDGQVAFYARRRYACRSYRNGSRNGAGYVSYFGGHDPDDALSLRGWIFVEERREMGRAPWSTANIHIPPYSFFQPLLSATAASSFLTAAFIYRPPQPLAHPPRS